MFYRRVTPRYASYRPVSPLQRCNSSLLFTPNVGRLSRVEYGCGMMQSALRCSESRLQCAPGSRFRNGSLFSLCESSRTRPERSPTTLPLTSPFCSAMAATDAWKHFCEQFVCYSRRHRWPLAALWFAMLIIAAAFGPQVSDATHDAFSAPPGSAAAKADKEIERFFPEMHRTSAVVVVIHALTPAKVRALFLYHSSAPDFLSFRGRTRPFPATNSAFYMCFFPELHGAGAGPV